MHKKLLAEYKLLKLILSTYAPKEIYISYLKRLLKNKRIKNIYRQEKNKFLSTARILNLSNDWFTYNIPHWLSVIDQYSLRNKKINALEIGSWEGLSSYFLLHSLPKSQLTCVDTWEGSEENKNVSSEILKTIETKFDENLNPFKERLKKHKGTSFSFFEKNQFKSIYDFIFIDGSHYCDDVMVDSIKCFELLKDGGIMIFDDYFWNYYKKPLSNPATAINLFLKMKKNNFKIISLSSVQLIIQKKATNT
jgi:predicted O-methyltransferase YrrM